MKDFFWGFKLRDRIKVPILRHRGKLISTCCGTLRQPRYRLQIGFPGSRDSRGCPCQTTQLLFMHTHAHTHTHQRGQRVRERVRERILRKEKDYTLQRMPQSTRLPRFTRGIPLVNGGSQPRGSLQPWSKTKCREIGTFIRSLKLVGKFLIVKVSVNFNPKMLSCVEIKDIFV